MENTSSHSAALSLSIHDIPHALDMSSPAN